MARWVGAGLAALLLVLAAGEVHAACRNDADCRDGTVCLYSRGSDDGACAKPDLQIDLPNDAAAPVPLSERPGAGSACQFTPDCLPGYRCYKRRGQMHGVCLQPQ